MIDTHSHILPGIDDGSKSFAESLRILRGLAKQGITDVICTPHYVPESIYISPRSKNEELLKTLQQKTKEKGISINLYLGNEIYIDREIAKLLRLKKITPLSGKGKYLLIELPMSGEFEQYEDIFLSLKEKGWQPILAHPERYHSFQKDFSKVESLHKRGILLQCNLGSFAGQYGKRAKKLAKQIAKRHLIFCVGTDIHHERNYDEYAKAQKVLRKYYQYAELDAILVQNARKIL